VLSHACARAPRRGGATSRNAPRPARCSHTRARAHPEGGGNRLVSAVVHSAGFANLETQNGKEHLAYMEDSP